ncbi:MAG: GNAT family N-acetyltransferase [Gemmatimonadota bacterium]
MISTLERTLRGAQQRFLIPVHTSIRPRGWIATHDALALPFKLRGTQRLCVGDVDGVALRVACVGRPKRFQPLLERLVCRSSAWRETGGLGTWAPESFEDLDAELVLVDVHRWAAARFRRAGWLVIPDSVRWVGDLTAVPPARPSKALRNDLKKVERHGYTLEEAGSADDWREFHERMVVPHARRRFGPEAWVPSSGMRRQIASRGRLLFVRRGGERLAGFSVLARGTTLWLVTVGLRDGDEALLREGAAVAIYAFLFAWGREQGFRRVDCGRTSSFLLDGVARHKRKWGLSAAPEALAHLTAARLDPRCTALRAVFRREPVFVEGGDGLGLFQG